MSQPLNVALYNRLKQIFRVVKVANPGIAMVGSYNIERGGFRKLKIENPGEYYLVNCPRCGDQRHRLWINHLWGKRDPKNGTRNLWLAVCYNEDCYGGDRGDEARLDLWERVSGLDGHVIETASITKGEVITTAREVHLPGACFRLDKLPMDHPANTYLAGRFYDPEKLGRYYGVSYCPDSHFYLARNRIIAPVYQDKKLKGWQARYIGELNWKAEDAPPKWWSCPGMDRSRILYNFDSARQFKTGVVMEGPGDTWAFGPMGVSCFGSVMTQVQERMFVAAFGSGSGVLLFDPDVQKDVRKLQRVDELHHRLQINKAFRHGIAKVWLPEGTDPGKLERRFLRDYVAHEAGKQGVKVDWRKK